jgi:hypothetical protein
VELLSVSSYYFFGCPQCHEIFIPLRQILFLGTARSHSEPNKGNRVGAYFSNRCFVTETAVRERLVCLVGNVIVGPNLRRSCTQVTASVFPHNRLSCLCGLMEWIQREQYRYYRRKWWALSLYLWFRYASFLGSSVIIFWQKIVCLLIINIGTHITPPITHFCYKT